MPKRFQHGFTLAEGLLATALLAIGIDAALAPFSARIEDVRIERATQDISRLQTSIESYRAVHHELPVSLAALGSAVPLDPWGRPYEYVNFELSGTAGQRAFNGLPVNSGYDLYSRGADGRTHANLCVAAARDDVIRARDGSYIGLASGF